MAATTPEGKVAPASQPVRPRAEPAPSNRASSRWRRRQARRNRSRADCSPQSMRDNAGAGNARRPSARSCPGEEAGAVDASAYQEFHRRSCLDRQNAPNCGVRSRWLLLDISRRACQKNNAVTSVFENRPAAHEAGLGGPSMAGGDGIGLAASLGLRWARLIAAMIRSAIAAVGRRPVARVQPWPSEQQYRNDRYYGCHYRDPTVVYSTPYNGLRDSRVAGHLRQHAGSRSASVQTANSSGGAAMPAVFRRAQVHSRCQCVVEFSKRSAVTEPFAAAKPVLNWPAAIPRFVSGRSPRGTASRSGRFFDRPGSSGTSTTWMKRTTPLTSVRSPSRPSLTGAALFAGSFAPAMAQTRSPTKPPAASRGHQQQAGDRRAAYRHAQDGAQDHA